MKFPKPAKHSNEIKTLDKWFSRFIRLRDSEDGYIICITCGMPVPVKESTCGHFITRNYWSHRYNEKNCHAQCWNCNCNQFTHGEAATHAIQIDKKYGEGTANRMLELKSRSGKLDKTQAKALSDEYRKKCNSMGKIKFW